MFFVNVTLHTQVRYNEGYQPFLTCINYVKVTVTKHVTKNESNCL